VSASRSQSAFGPAQPAAGGAQPSAGPAQPASQDDGLAAARQEPERLSLTVGGAQAGLRLDAFLAPVLGSRARAQALIDEGAVLVAGARRPKSHRLAAGEVVLVRRCVDEPRRAPATRATVRIAYEDDHLLVVDKPAGMVVHPARGHPDGTLAQALEGIAAGGEHPWRAGIVHRLDRGTSGLLLVAKREEVHRALRELLAARLVAREYLALVQGLPAARSGTIDAPVGRDRRDRLRVSLDSDVAREARTHFEIARRLPTTTLLRVRLETGRTHQIRVHMAAIGHPVCGDPLYGAAGALGLERQFLHAARLSLPHPVGGGQLEVSSPLPDDLRRALERAERAGG